MTRWNQKTERLREGATRAAHGVVDRVLHIILSPIRFFKFICFAVGFGVIMVTLCMVVYIYSFLTSLPDVRKLDIRSVEIIAKGKVMAKLENKQKKLRWVDLKNISKEYFYAIVHSEDATFFEHSGFNFEAIANSLAENIKERKVVFGGSTISQQVVKNLFLTPERTVSRKIKEFLITRDLEKHFTKNDILEIYLNIAELGPDIYGVNEAAWHYFRKQPKDINAAEGAFIALMLPSPKRHYYSIFQNRNLTRIKKKKIERVLRDMLYEELLTEKQYRQYAHYPYFAEGFSTGPRVPATKGARGE